MKKKNVTISDIADKLCVSKTTVSFAFNCPNRISKDTADRIYAAAKEMGYSPVTTMRGYQLGYYKTIGLLLPQAVEDCLSNPYMLDVIRGATCVCEEHGFMLNIIPPFLSSIPAAVRNAAVDGLIILGLDVNSQIIESFGKKDLPVVAIDGSNCCDVVSVGIDEEEAAYTQMMHALKHGHNKIAVLSLPNTTYPSLGGFGVSALLERRLAGYSKALGEYGMSLEQVNVISSFVSYDATYKCICKLLDDKENIPTCFVCMSDIAALATYGACCDKHFKIPKDISIIGFDGLDIGTHIRNTLTTISQRGDKKGQLAARLVFKMLKGDVIKENSNYIPFSFVKGGTLAKYEAAKYEA